MGYGELHFNSALDQHGASGEVLGKGTRSRRTLEFNEPVQIDRFLVKDLELPLFWCNVAGGTINYFIDYDNGALPITRFSYAGVIATACHTGTSFAAALQTMFTTTAATGAPANAPDITQWIVTLVDDKLQFTFPVAMHAPVLVGLPGTTHFQAFITWPDSLKKLFSRSWDDTGLLTFPRSPITASYSGLQSYPLRMVPNYVYLHSDLMAGTSFFSVSRALGMSQSRTIMARIPVDTSKEWQVQSMQWVNPAPDPSFMFQTSGQEFGRIEFWFTDEWGTELEFQNVNFSLTLALFCR